MRSTSLSGAPWRLGAPFSGVKVVERLFLIIHSTMGRAVYTEKGSCRHCVDNGLMERELTCSACQERAQRSDRPLWRMEEQGDFSIKGVCHHLHGPLSQPAVDRRAAANSPSRRRLSGSGLRQAIASTEGGAPGLIESIITRSFTAPLIRNRITSRSQ